MTSAPAIGFEYRPSRLPARLLTVVALLAVLAIALCGVPWWLKLLLVFAVLAGWLHALRPSPNPVIAAGWAGDGRWSLHHRNGDDTPATLASFRVLGDFVQLRLATGRRRATVLLLAPDNSDADIRRRLRMRLAATQPDEALTRI